MNTEIIVNFYAHYIGELEQKINECLQSKSELGQFKNTSEL